MWEENHFRLFLSHISSQKEMAQSLKVALKDYCISCFVAHDDIEPTHHWQSEIEAALTSMHALAALLSKGFHESKWTDQEVGYAMGSGRLVLPIRCGADPHGFIGKYQAYTMKENALYRAVASDIAAILSRHPQTAPLMAGALVTRLETSRGFDSSKQTMGLLEGLPTIPKELLSRIEAAEKSNFEVASAWGVPERIRKLIQRHSGAADYSQN